MARIRTIKPEFFLHEDLFDLEDETGLPVRLGFIGLWCHVDREGRFDWRPRKLKAQIFPYCDTDFSRVLHALASRGFVRKYTVKGVEYGHVPGFSRHQVINNREKESERPDPSTDEGSDACPTRDDASATPLKHAQAEGKGSEQDKGSREQHADSDRPTRPDCLERFVTLWQSWPDDLGSKGSKVNAEKAFLKLRPDDLLFSRMRQALISQIEHKRSARAEGQFAENFQHVERWIKNRRWEDELPDLPGPSGDGGEVIL